MAGDEQRALRITGTTDHIDLLLSLAACGASSGPPVKLRGAGKRSTRAQSSRPLPSGLCSEVSAAVRAGGSAAWAGISCRSAVSACGWS